MVLPATIARTSVLLAWDVLFILTIDGVPVASANQPRTVQTPRHVPNTDGKSNPTPGVCRDIPYQYTTGMRSRSQVVSVRAPRDTEENGVTATYAFASSA